MKILFLTPYPLGAAPSQRFRFEQYLNVLEKKGFHCVIKPFFNNTTWQVLYNPGNWARKIFGLIQGFCRRSLLLLTLGSYQLIFIHREAAPLGPPILEWLMAKLWKKRIIYDFDDAIWLANTSKTSWIISKLKWPHKVPLICRWSYKVSAGNNYLYNFAKTYCDQVLVNPTTIDVVNHHNQFKNRSNDKLIIGWTGSHSTIGYLQLVVPYLKILETRYCFDFVVIADQDPKLPLNSFSFKPWRIATEVEDLLNFDIGIMPLADNVWTRGKCGFKALQYLALGIPAVVSPVGVNCEIIEHQVNGLLCKSKADWIGNLSMLLEDHQLRTKMGAKGRETVRKHYSVEANKDNFLSLFA